MDSKFRHMKTNVENEENVEQITTSELTAAILVGGCLTATVSIILLIAIGAITILCF